MIRTEQVEFEAQKQKKKSVPEGDDHEQLRKPRIVMVSSRNSTEYRETSHLLFFFVWLLSCFSLFGATNDLQTNQRRERGFKSYRVEREGDVAWRSLLPTYIYVYKEKRIQGGGRKKRNAMRASERDGLGSR